MNDILFGNNNSEVITKLSKRYFKKNKVRNLAALLAIILTAFLFTSITSLAFNMASSIQLSLQMQKGSKADGTLGYMTEEQYEQLVNSDFVEQAGHRRIIGYASNTSSHSIEINYADSVQQELTFCVPTHGAAPEKANEIATTDLALKALGVEPKIGAAVPLEFELRGKTYHYDMVLSGWWEASNDSVSVATVSEQFIKTRRNSRRNRCANLWFYTQRLQRQIRGGDLIRFLRCSSVSRHTEGQLLLHTVRIINLNGMAGSIACIANDAPVTCLLHKIAVYKLLVLFLRHIS